MLIIYLSIMFGLMIGSLVEGSTDRRELRESLGVHRFVSENPEHIISLMYSQDAATARIRALTAKVVKNYTVTAWWIVWPLVFIRWGILSAMDRMQNLNDTISNDKRLDLTPRQDYWWHGKPVVLDSSPEGK